MHQRRLRGVSLTATMLAAAVGHGAAQQSYALVCRGGGVMRMAMHHRVVIISFVPASAGAGVRPPAPGECAWLDRGWRAGEAADLVWFSGGGAEVAAVIRAIDSPETSSIDRFEIEGRDAGKVGQYRYLYDAMRGDGLFNLAAYKLSRCRERGLKWPWESRMEFKPCFWVTRVGP